MVTKTITGTDNKYPHGYKAGEKIGTTEWLEVRQIDINTFAAVTRDMDPLHIDPVAAEAGPFGQTMAFAFQTLSYLTYWSHELTDWEASSAGLNYGFNRIRFTEMVHVGARLRAHFFMNQVEERPAGGTLVTMDVSVEIEGKEKPALVAQWMGLSVPKN